MFAPTELDTSGIRLFTGEIVRSRAGVACSNCAKPEPRNSNIRVRTTMPKLRLPLSCSRSFRLCGGVLGLLVLGLLSAQAESATASETFVPDLTGVPAAKGWKLVKRTAVAIEKDGAPGARLLGNAARDTGFARLEGFDFADGVIEFDVRGKNVLQGSFPGFAFHGLDDTTYDAVYFRPFNFRSGDPVRRTHAVQYVSHPTFTWEKLRKERNGRYEKSVAPVPDPEGWFHVRVVVAWPQVSVFVDDAAEPSLVVEQLSDRKHGWLGFWTDVSDGDFANLKIVPAYPRRSPNQAQGGP